MANWIFCANLLTMTIGIVWTKCDFREKTNFFEKKTTKKFVESEKSITFATAFREMPLRPERKKALMTGGNSSVGRAQPCQGWGRGSESRFPLNILKQHATTSFVSRWLLAQVAELVDAHVSGACAARRAGSSPVLGTHSVSECLLVGEVAELVDALL